VEQRRAEEVRGVTESERLAAIRDLYRARSRSRLARASGWGLLALAAVAWLSGVVGAGELFTARRLGNLARFLREDALPRPLRDEEGGLAELLEWAWGVLAERGFAGTAATLAIAVAAAVLAGVLGALLAPLGARTLATREPFLLAGGAGWRALVAAARGACVLLRALPEYVWAFLLVAVLGPSAWPAVLALAVHNAGILGRLGADTIENLDRAPLASLRSLGATRRQLVLLAVPPLALPRYLLYGFYRFETCVREATVLGMLGVVSLGYWIRDARARQRYDELLLLVLCGAVLVILGDITSHFARRWVRRAR
jgi:phosphonate transport system permease protein